MEAKRRSLPARDELHALRKTWHVLGGMAMALGYEVLGITHWEAVVISGGIFTFFLSMEMGRRYSPLLNDLLIRFWGPFMRKHEVNQRSGMFYFSAGAVFITTIFAKPIVILSLLYLSLGDPFASFLGIIFKHISSMRLRSGKSLVGTLGMFLLCISVTYYFLTNAGLKQEETIWIATISAITASIAELLCPNPLPLDDNLVIPVTSAFALWLSFLSVGINPHHIKLFTLPSQF